MKIKKSMLAIVVTAVLATLIPVEQASATTVSRGTIFRIAAHVSKTQVQVNAKFTLSGSLSPAKGNITVRRERLKNGKWVKQSVTKTNKRGRWKFDVAAPAQTGVIKYRFVTPYFAKTPPTIKQVEVIPIPDPTISLRPVSGEMPAGSLISLLGKYSDVGDSISITVNQLVGDLWQPISANATVGNAGWAARITLPMEPGTYSYQAVANTSRGIAISDTVVVTVQPPVPNAIRMAGPGTPGRIWGMDIARYQHMADTNGDGVKDINDDGIPIDFAKAYANGMRFVFIKASDGYIDPKDNSKTADDYALKFATQDRVAAQAAGIYTGLYHFPAMPSSEKRSVLIKDARQEAIQAAARLAKLGGYTSMDLPYVLDVENGDYGRGISRTASAAAITLWVKTWIIEFKARTGRTPIVYSGPNFISNYFLPDDIWATVPLWIAHYGCTDRVKSDGSTKCITDTHAQAIAKVNAGRLPATGYNTVYHVNGLLNWSFWQYSSRAYGKTFGINNGAALDVNVFSGTSEQFMAFTQQLWQPLNPDDYQAVSTPINLTATYETATADEPITIIVRASRVDNGSDALSGEIVVKNNGAKIAGLDVTPVGVGVWAVTLPAMPIDTVWNLGISFEDSWNFYAANSTTLTVNVGSIA